MNPLELAGARPGPDFEITFDGRALEALPGRTIAAALWAAGITSWRTTRDGGRRAGCSAGSGCASTVWSP